MNDSERQRQQCWFIYTCKNGGVGKLVEMIWRKRNSWRKYHKFVASV